MYPENNTLSIIFQNNDLLLGVAGEFNNNLKELEKLTQTYLYSRGNSILVKSDPEKNNIIKKKKVEAAGIRAWGERKALRRPQGVRA